MYDFRINFNEEDEAKEVIESLKEYCIGLKYDRAIAYVDGYLGAMQDYRDRYQQGYTNMQIMYIGFHVYRWLASKILTHKETK